jgi:23S rRNA maturation-related 3'-5' exoribonuclease YhaM
MMTETDKINVFKNEYLYIKDDRLREDAKYLIGHLPDYFFKVDASSTGKYHPKYAAGEGGLTRHVKSACKFAYELLANPSIGKIYSDRDKDLIIIALLIHDGLKYGSVKEEYTRFDHPLLASKYLIDNENNLSMNDEDITKTSSAIASHMGPWNTSSYSDIELPVPKTAMEKFVHMCDYLASRRFINLDFDNESNVIDESKM